MIPLWCYMRLFRVERVREADKGKNKGKKSRRNEITPGGGMKEICGFVRGQLQRCGRFPLESALFCCAFVMLIMVFLQ